MPNLNVTYFPKNLSNKATAAYVISFLVVSLLFIQHVLPLWLMIFGVISVIVFFHFSNALSVQWMRLSSKAFEKKLFWTAFIIRFAYVIFIYNLNYELYGTFHESQGGDITWYVPTAEYFSDCLHNGNLTMEMITSNVPDFSDSGYIAYLTLLYYVSFDVSSIILPLILKAMFGAFTCINIYMCARNHFIAPVARMSGIFCALQFNMIWWCGSMMKETEMIFVMSLFLCRADNLLSQKKSNQLAWVITILIGFSLFTFRTVLGLMCFCALFATILLADKNVVSMSRKIVAGIFVSLMLLVVAGDRVIVSVRNLAETAADTSYQERNMEWRTRRGGMGNSFAKYAGAAVFAPLIFTIPFPSMVYTYQDQEMQVMVNGGNYVKNVLSFFVIYVMFYLLFSGEWRKHVFPIALLVGYLVALVFSVFGHSGRFHMPAVPLEMMFAAYGFSIVCEKNKLRWFNYVLVVEFVCIIAWNWVKLSGRGMA